MNLRSRTCLLLSCLSLLLTTQPAWAQGEASILDVGIGFAAPLGEVRVQAGLDAAELAVEQANQRNPQVGGRKVRFVLRKQDDKGDARTAPLVAQYLADRSVVGVIGHWTSSCSIAAAPVYQRAGIAQVSPASTSRKFTQLNAPTTFRIMGHDDDSGTYLARYVVNEMKAQRIMIVDDGSQFGIGLADQFSNIVRAEKGRIVARNSISNKTSDFNAVLRTAKEEKADLIFLSARVNQSGEFIRNMKRLEVSATLLATGGTVSVTFLSTAGDAAEGAMAMEPGPALERLPDWKKLQKEFATRGKGEIAPFTIFTYDATNVLIAAILQANSLQPAEIVKAMHQIRYKGVTGNISFDSEGNLQQPMYTLYRVQNKAWVPVKSFGASAK